MNQKELQISIHSPYTGRDNKQESEVIKCLIFQSTLPIQGETFDSLMVDLMAGFQSTLPIQGETEKEVRSKYGSRYISIHSPYTGRDTEEEIRKLKKKNFNPLSLYRERPYHQVTLQALATFQSTLPIQGETAN